MSGRPPAAQRPSSLAAILLTALLAFAGFALHLSPWGGQASHVLLDACFGLVRAFAPVHAPDDIVIVGVEEASAVSPDVDPVGPALRSLPDVLVRITRGNARAVSLHVPLPRTTLEAAAPGLDDAIATALSVAHAAAPLAIGMAVDSRRNVIPIHDPLLRGVDARSLVFTLLPRDGDDRVRHVVLALPTQQGEWPTSAGRLCEKLGGQCERGLIDYGLGPAYRYIPARRLLDVRDDAALARLFRDRVVFVASVSGPDDRVAQPVSLAGWEPPSDEPASVLAHAQTLRTLLHGRPIREVPLPGMLLVIAAAAVVALAAASLAPAVGALAAIAAFASALVALRTGWYLPLAAPLATLLAAVMTSRILGARAGARRRDP